MSIYRVSFYKDLLNSDGHSFRCLQRQVDIQSESPSRARVLAKGLIDDERLHIDCVEVVHLAGDHPDLKQSAPPTVPCKHTWSRASHDKLTMT
ncbi:hypothetical protein ASC80_10370 [Afipia sp. Root123D2]|uniref:hypothetical protein n=1 Tax=Afipia sp. Root123D2 TaxID=1736436 RepID=UPI0006FDC01E|nr:hypothetical protein [Afipia sp. Root123D2]KQW20632.1 hypothetical protein ASC80_10370 [Afipia sp. Root123D2]